MEANERKSRLNRRVLTPSAIFVSLAFSQNLSLASAFRSFSPVALVDLSVGESRHHYLPGSSQHGVLLRRPNLPPLFSVSSQSTAYVRTKTTASAATLPSTRRIRRTTETRTSSRTTRGQTTTKRQRRRQGHHHQWERMIAELAAFRTEKGHALVTAADVDENPKWQNLYVWTKSIRRNYAHQVLESRSRRTAANATTYKTHLAAEKIQILQQLDFCWDVQSLSWERRYQQLVHFFREHGHSRVPGNYPGGLGIFVRNCRREYRRLEQGEPSTLTVDRLNKLIAVDFVWYKSREEAWEYRYKQLQEFYSRHGHSNVPNHYALNPKLGNWCMNQRTYYKRRYRGEMSSLTEERIQLMEDLGFIWNYRKHQFDAMLNRLAKYYRENGHTQIATADVENRDLRFWVTIQRYYYHCRQRDLNTDGYSSVSLTEDRIKAIEAAVPDFHWRARANNSGPSSQDWAMLFDEMRKKGIRPGMREKRHWFDGVNPFKVTVKDTWTDDDLMALWNADDDNDDEDDDDWVDQGSANSDEDDDDDWVD